MDPLVQAQIVQALKVFLRTFQRDAPLAWRGLTTTLEALGYFVNREVAVRIGVSANSPSSGTAFLYDASVSASAAVSDQQIGIDEFPVSRIGVEGTLGFGAVSVELDDDFKFEVKVGAQVEVGGGPITVTAKFAADTEGNFYLEFEGVGSVRFAELGLAAGFKIERVDLYLDEASTYVNRVLQNEAAQLRFNTQDIGQNWRDELQTAVFEAGQSGRRFNFMHWFAERLARNVRGDAGDDNNVVRVRLEDIGLGSLGTSGGNPFFRQDWSDAELIVRVGVGDALLVAKQTVNINTGSELLARADDLIFRYYATNGTVREIRVPREVTPLLPGTGDYMLDAAFQRLIEWNSQENAEQLGRTNSAGTVFANEEDIVARAIESFTFGAGAPLENNPAAYGAWIWEFVQQSAGRDKFFLNAAVLTYPDESLLNRHISVNHTEIDEQDVIYIEVHDLYRKDGLESLTITRGTFSPDEVRRSGRPLLEIFSEQRFTRSNWNFLSPGVDDSLSFRLARTAAQHGQLGFTIVHRSTMGSTLELDNGERLVYTIVNGQEFVEKIRVDGSRVAVDEIQASRVRTLHDEISRRRAIETEIEAVRRAGPNTTGDIRSAALEDLESRAVELDNAIVATSDNLLDNTGPISPPADEILDESPATRTPAQVHEGLHFSDADYAELAALGSRRRALEIEEFKRQGLFQTTNFFFRNEDLYDEVLMSTARQVIEYDAEGQPVRVRGRQFSNDLELGAAVASINGARVATGVGPNDIILRDTVGRPVRDAQGNIRTAGTRVSGSNGAVIKTYDEGPLKGITRISLDGAPLGLDFRHAGQILGSLLGKSIAGDNKIVRAASGAVLKTVGGTLGSLLNGAIGGADEKQLNAVLSSFDKELGRNLGLAAVNLASDFVAKELFKALGIKGFAGEIGSAAVSEYLSSVLSSALNLQTSAAGPNVIVAIGAMIGSKLASEVYTFKSVGGQIGASIGAKLGTLIAGGNPVLTPIFTFLGQLIGGTIGSLFGGTPRSGADLVWDDASGELVVANVYSKKGGSKDTARQLAGDAADILNEVIQVTGGKLTGAKSIDFGNYGMRSDKLVFRLDSSSNKDRVAASFKGKDAYTKVLDYGFEHVIRHQDFQITGGNKIVKRAIYNLVDSTTSGSLSRVSVFGSLATAQAYSNYLSNRSFFDYLIATSEEAQTSNLAAEIALTLLHARDLGLHRRGRSDWIGGYTNLFERTHSQSSDLTFRMRADSQSGKLYRVLDLGFGYFNPQDQIDIAGQTEISAGSGADIIDLRSGKLANQIGLTVNDRLIDNVAVTGADFASVNRTVSFNSNDRRQTVSVAVTGDGVQEKAESFSAALANAIGMQVIGGEATALILDGTSAKPTLMIGNSFAYESDGHAVFRLSLSRAATADVTIQFSLASRTAELGADFGNASASDIQFSLDGTNWTNGSSITLTSGQTEMFVRTAVRTDNSPNPAYVAPVTDPSTGAILVPGNDEPEFLNIEANERFSLIGTISSGLSAVANETDKIAGIGTIVDGAGDKPLVWVDSIVVDEGSSNAIFNVLRSRTSGTSTSVEFATSDRRELEIDVAATVDGGAGDDTIYASNLGDNLFGGDGNDTLYGGRLDDWLLGGDGNDTLDAGTLDQAALGGDGNYLNGGAGNDVLRGREGSDWLEGGDGADILTGAGGDDILAAGSGAGDISKGGMGDDQYLVRLGDGEDVAEDEATGAPADTGAGDAITQRYAGIAAGTIKKNWAGSSLAVRQQKLAGGEDSMVFGYGIAIGDIQLARSIAAGGGAGNDLVVRIMQTEEDANGVLVESYSGTSLTVKDWFTNPFKRIEWLKFADGTEIRIGDITSFIIGGEGNDVLVGTQGNDFVYGGAGNDKLFLLGGDDIGNGGTGDDMVSGDAGRDLVIGGIGADELIGGAGSDAISGDDGADDIYGGADRDVLSGGRGDGDQLAGGGGDDTFKYSRGDGKDTVFDDFSNNWDVVWTAAGQWNTAAGFSYNGTTGEVTGPGGVLIRRNFGTADAPDFQWVGRFDYDSAAQSLRRFNPPVGATTTVANNGVDTIEFAPGINLQDVILRRVGNDLVMAIGNDEYEASDSSRIADSVTIKDWYVAPGQIEKLAFYETGILDISSGVTNVVAGTDGAEGTTTTPLAGTTLADWMSLGAGDDVAAGGAGNDILAGNSGSDILRGEAGDDVLYGGTGNDSLDGGAGKDVLVGGNGIDTASYASATAATRIRLSFQSNGTADALGDEYYSIENVTGGSAADNIGGDLYDNEIDGGGGADTLMGGAGDDTYIWNTTSGADTIREGAFVVEEVVTTTGVLAPGYTTSWTNTGTPSSGGKFYWRLQVRNSANEIVYDLATYSYAANTAMPAPTAWNVAGWLGGFAKTNGNQVTRDKFDTMISGGGNDVIEFGAGISLSDLTFIRASAGVANATGPDLIVRYNNSTSTQITIANHFTTYGGVETLQFRDGLAVSLASILSATSTAALNGTANDDLIVGQTGTLNDELYGLAGNDVLSGMAGVDKLYGGDGDDVLEGGAGADILDGGANATGGTGDTVRYIKSAAVTIDLQKTTAQAGGDAAGDTLFGIENVVGSQTGNDVITGDANANRIDGLDGNNTINGKGGNDVLISGAGADIIYGDLGDDNISSGDGNDQLWGGDGKDVLFAGAGNDQLRGEAGDDQLLGGEGDDSVLDGGIGNDEIYGDAGNDTLTGGDGNDTLGGGTGNDSLQGGLGDDVYFVQSNDGSDTIVDTSGTNIVSFDSGVTHDRIWLTQAGSDLRIGVIGENTLLTVTGFFASTTPSRIKSIQTTTHAIYLDHPDVLNLISAMTAASATVPAAVPLSIADVQGRYWHQGGKAKPIAPAAPRAIATSEDTAVAVDGNYGVIDHDSNVNGYQLKNDAMPAKGTISNFNAATGAFTYTPTANLNGVDSFVVIVTDADGNATELPVAVTIAAVNDGPGGIAVQNGATLSVVESTPATILTPGTVIGAFEATDPEGDSFTYALVNSAGGRFALSASGVLSIANPSSIDFEAAPSHTIRISVTDALGASREQDFVIAVQNGNEANSLPASYSLSIAESAAIGTTVGSVAASDIDTSGDFASQRYYFWDGTAATGTSNDGRYAINATTGQVTVNSALNFEGAQPSKTYTVVARDNAGTAGYNQVQTAVTIGITDVNEANSLPATYAMSVNENVAVGTVVGSVAATDADAAGTPFAQQRYYFWDGTSASSLSSDGRYSISATTGQITTNAALNFEAPQPSKTYQVVARDNAGNAGYNQVQSAVTIGIADVNEANAIPASYSMAVNENVAIGTVVGSVAATDIDASGVFAQQRYYFWDGTTASATSSDGRYAINAATGQITTNAPLNFEAALPSKTYQVIARDNAGNAGYNQVQSAVTIGITDLNEAPVSLNWSPSLASVAERDRIASGGTRPAIALGTLSVTDPDTAGFANATYTYAVSDARFEVVGATLRLKQDASFDFEAGAAVDVTITATDQTGTPFTINRLINIAITDQDDILEGGTGNDTLTGQQGRDIITGNAGNDTISGLAGNDSLDGGDGADQISGGDGNDTILGQAGADLLYGGLGADTLRGGSEDDRLFGEDGNDALYGDAGSEGVRASGGESWRGFTVAGLSGGAGDDLVDGGDGDDYLDGGAGADQLIGGLGFDGVDYGGSNAAVTVNLTTGAASGGTAQGDTLSGIELVQGSIYGDTLTGSAGSDVIYGGDGNDTIVGGAGNDYLFGGAGNDTIDAQAGDDMLDGGAGDDILNGGIDNDVYVVTRSSGADTINNYDPSGDDIDVIGFNDMMGAINDQDLWFEKIGNDLKITVIGTGSSVRVANWYTVTDANSRANHKIDFIIANTSYSRTLNVEGLVTLMATKPKPATTAERDTLMADLNYKAVWATHWNSNAAPVLAAIAQQSTNEDVAKVFSVTATDDITPNTQVSLSAQVISGGHIVTVAGIGFGTPDANGVRTMTINPVANASGTARIKVTAVDAGGVSSSQEFDIVVNAVADTPTVTQVTSSGGTSGHPAGIPLTINVSFPDNDGSETHEIWITGVPVGVTLSAGSYDSGSATWRLVPAQLANLKLHAPAGWSEDITIGVRGRATENGATAVSAKVDALVVVNAPPTGATFSGSVNENAANGTAVASVAGIDPDAGDTLTYALTDTAGGRFAISNGGAVSVANGALLNFETATSHSITVRITDSRGEFIDRSFAIGVTNVNEANSLPAGYGFAVNENVAVGTAVGSVAASDIDTSGAFAEQRYYFWNGSSASATSSDGRYAINATTGLITTNAALNFEAGTTSVAYTVIARDNQGNAGYNQTQSTVTIGINNVNEQNSLPSSYGFAVQENLGIGTAVGTVAASDIDTSGAFAEQRYYFWDGTSASAFSWDGRYQINATTGAITTNQVFDFEAGSTSRAYTVIARDNQGTAGYTQAASTVTIGITNQNETPNAPNSGTPSGGATVWSFFDESGLGSNPATPGAVVATFAMSDVDGTTPALRFTSNPGGWFEIVGNQVRWAAGVNFDYETLRAQGYGTYDWNGDGRIDAHIANVYVEAFDGQYDSGETLLQVFISNVNEAPSTPGGSWGNYFTETGLGSNPANAYVVAATFSQFDIDGTTPTLQFASGGNPNNWFYIAGNEVRFNPGLNFDFEWARNAGYTVYDWNGDGRLEAHVATVTVQSSDGQFGSGTASTHIFIEDVNEQNAMPGSYTFAVNEEQGAGIGVGSVSATDVDSSAYAFGQQRYYFWNGSSATSVSSDGRYAINAVTGQITTNAVLNFEAGSPSAAYTVIARDNQGNAGYTQASSTVTIGINDVNEAHSLSAASFTVNESNTALGPLIPLTNTANAVINVRSSMLSDPEGRNMRWQFDNGSTVNGPWQIEQDGTLRMIQGTDYEELIAVYEEQPVDYDYDGYPDGTQWVRVGSDPSKAIFNLGVQAIDDSIGLVRSATLTLTVADVNEAPSVGGYASYSGGGGGSVITQGGNEFWVTKDKNGGYIVQLYGADPEGQSVSFSIVNPQAPIERIGYYGGNNEIDATDYPYVYLDAYNRINFWTPGEGNGDWEGGVRIGGTRRTSSVELNFMVRATDASGNFTDSPFKIVFTRRDTNAPPIVLDLDGDGLELVPYETSTVEFDMDGDDIRDETGWAAADDGFLALDRNRNGVIDNITEISFASDAEGALSDLEGLRAFDTDNDGYLDEDDAQFASFLIWRDVNQDGVSQASELKSLLDWGIKSINLSLTLTGAQPGDGGNVIFGTTEYEKTDGTSGIVGDVFLAYSPSNIDSLATPIVFDFDGDDAGLIKVADSNVRFDMDGNGTLDKTGWIATGDAFLALDRNGNGRIDDIREISFVEDREGATTDLEGLRAFDSDGDGQLTGEDERFSEFKLWFDTNSNGVTDAGELQSLAEAGITSIDLAGTPGDVTDEAARPNIVYNRTSFVRTDGTSGTAFDAGIAFERPDANSSTEIAYAGWSGEMAPPADTTVPLPAIAMESRGFEKKAKRYAIDIRDGGMFVSDRKAKGVVDSRAGAVGGAAILSFKNSHVGMLSPVVLDLDGDGLDLVSRKKSKAAFDMDGDGRADKTGWVGKGDGMLVIDRNNDGKITGASEISFLTEKPDAKSDLEALATLDSNRDGRLDAQDTRFGELKIWVDADQNGISDDGELQSLAELGITEIGLAGRTNSQQVKIGDNAVLATATFKRTDGSVGTVGDVALAFDPSSKRPAPADSQLAALRRGFDGGFSEFDGSQRIADAPSTENRLDTAAVFSDVRLAQMIQSMAAFGASAGDGNGVQSRRNELSIYDLNAVS